MKISIANYFAHAVRVAVAAGAMLVVGWVASICIGGLISILGIQSVVAVFVGFALIAIIGIAGGTYFSVRYVTRNSVLHPVVAAAVLGLFPVGFTFHGDVGLIRTSILAGTVGVAVIAAYISRSLTAPPNSSLERARGE
jgi:hypothetical protein